MKINTGKISPWNRNLKIKVKVFYPKNIKNLTEIIKLCKKQGRKYLIRTGNCSYDGKSLPNMDDDYVISLKNFNKIIKINKKSSTIILQTGVIISDFLKKMKNKNISLYSIPGGSGISIGGAISANAIGKDSNKTIGSFGDTVCKLTILNEKGKLKRISKKKEVNNYVGAFGMNGIIIDAEIKFKKILSQNVLLKTKKLYNFDQIWNAFNDNIEYQFVQVDPLLRKKNFAILFNAFSIKEKKNLFKETNASIFLTLTVKLASFFMSDYLWGLFYKVFDKLNSKVSKKIDLHNLYYQNSFKNVLPIFFKEGICEYEILISKNFRKIMSKILSLIKGKYTLSYIVIKKIYNSKNNFNYKFNKKTGLSVSFGFTNIDPKGKDRVENFFKKNNLEVNATKNDRILIKNNKKNNLFMSKYKKILEVNEISR